MDWLLASLDRRVDLALEYVGKLYTGDEPCFQEIYLAIDQIVTKKGINQARTKREIHPLAWVQQMQWSKDARWTYAKLVEMGEEKRHNGRFADTDRL
jgi:hypothetical protein